MTKLMLIVVILVVVGCTGIPIYQLPHSEVDESSAGVAIMDARPGNAKFYSETTCENVKTRQIQLGDENFSQNRLLYLEKQLSIYLPEEMRGNQIELVSFDTQIVQVDGCQSHNLSYAMYAVSPAATIGLSASEAKQYKEDSADYILSAIAIFIDGKKYSGTYKNNSFGYLGDSIFDDSAVDVAVTETVALATKALIRDIRGK